MINGSNLKTVTCKNCGSSLVVRFGTYKGAQRYWCKSCQRKFKSDGGFHTQVPVEYISRALDLYYHGMFIKSIAIHLKREYNYHPSKSTIFNWASKYTSLIIQQFKEYCPQVGNIWILDKIRLNINEKNQVWFYYVIDRKTRFLLAFKVVKKTAAQDVKKLKAEASKKAGLTNPKEIITDDNYSYLDEIGLSYCSEIENTREKSFTYRDTMNMIKRFHGTLKDRTQIIRYFTNLQNMIQFANGLTVLYNYFKPQESLSSKTPAEIAGIKYNIKNWSDLIRVPVWKKPKT